ncbi:sugar-transfer associated ATP-grasp domain-containing protein [Mongoliitalea daihaiensis]|uniref:sugar-transfer associated ATP-grasp domain-containing protein n=1 Tax=Mongoliitalea daihaiensis TaxID=2782006 RepID=UPI001F17A7D9|nr:sugar-transfer associated ATP-grasp domain-containing protein [Mongoliitalea daihaiensis]UJP64454.1 hexapeptide transferase [Mongoliitalea daihaiensis]
MFKRLLYLGYYLKQLDRRKFYQFLNHSVTLSGTSNASITLDALSSVFRYNISLLEYFQFRFFELSKEERQHWAGTGYMYEYQLRMNPISARHILDDKTLFYKNYGEFFVHQVADLEAIRKDLQLAQALLRNPSGKIVLKVSDGKCGKGVLIRESIDFVPASLIQFMEQEGYELAEEFLIQHSSLQKLSPSAVNTVRIFTQLNSGNEVELLGCRLRISINSPVDNMAAGNIAAKIDDKTGIVTGPGVYSDITKSDEAIHPITGVNIEGFQVPFWKETLEMVEKAALKHPQNRSIGWDVVITEKGPGLIEGNHDWCKLLWQLPMKKGLKAELEKFK